MNRDRTSRQEQREGSAQPPKDNTVFDAVPCSSCGYDLQGSLDTGRCPECGTPIPSEDSRTLARFGAETWLRNAQRGVRLWGAGATGVVLSALALLASEFIPGGSWNSDAGYLLLWAGMTGLGVSVCVAVYGMWQLSARHPVIDRQEKRLSARRVIRVALVLVLAGVVLNWIPAASPLAFAPLFVLYMASGLKVGPFAMVGLLAMTRRVAQFCELADDEERASRVKSIGWAYALACVLLLGTLTPRGFGDSLRLFTALASALGILIFGLLGVYTPCYLIPHFRAALAELERTRIKGVLAATTGKLDDVRPTTISESEEPHGS